MKHLLSKIALVLPVLSIVLCFNTQKANCQTYYYGGGLSRPNRTASQNTNWVSFDNGTYQNSPWYFGFEIVSTHNYTLQATNALVKITAANFDTINLIRSKFSAGQRTKFFTTVPTNDSTLFLPDSGTINGASLFWLVGAVNTYKGFELFFDGTNYFILK